MVGSSRPAVGVGPAHGGVPDESLPRAGARNTPAARITATDLNEAMVRYASSRVEGVDWRQADAMALPFDDEAFDLVVCQFGVMFFRTSARPFARSRVSLPGGAIPLQHLGRHRTQRLRCGTDGRDRQGFPQRPADLPRANPHGYADLDEVSSDLGAAGLHVDDLTTVTLTGHADFPAQLATGFCQGTPLRLEIEERASLAEVTRLVADEVTRGWERAGCRGISAPTWSQPAADSPDSLRRRALGNGSKMRRSRDAPRRSRYLRHRPFLTRCDGEPASSGTTRSAVSFLPRSGSQGRRREHMGTPNGQLVPDPFGPLQGLRIVSTGTLIAQPFAAHLAALFGAEVIQVEHPSGTVDPWRTLDARMQGSNGAEVATCSIQERRNAFYVSLDLSVPEGRELFLRLIRTRDIWMESSKPGTFDKWGLGDEVVHEANPGLVITHVSGYGQSGHADYLGRASYDMIGQAFGGLMNLTGFADPEPRSGPPPTPATTSPRCLRSGRRWPRTSTVSAPARARSSIWHSSRPSITSSAGP